MSKLSKRLEMVASFIDENDKSVIDIGCDHGLLSIYLAEKFNNLKNFGRIRLTTLVYTLEVLYWTLLVSLLLLISFCTSKFLK